MIDLFANTASHLQTCEITWVYVYPWDDILKKVRDLEFEGHVSRSRCRHEFFWTARSRKCNIRHQTFHPSAYTPWDTETCWKKCVTSGLKVTCQGHGVGMHFFELPDLENVILDTSAYSSWDIETLKKVRGLEFEGYVSGSRCQHTFFGTARPRKCNIGYQHYYSSAYTSLDIETYWKNSWPWVW